MVYVIEDDNHVRKALELLMKSNNYDCQSFIRGEDFLADRNQKSVQDILILDMNMKGVFGRDFLRQLISMNNPVSVIGITAHDQSSIRAFCREFGVKALLTKPVDSNALMDLIKFHSEMHEV